MMVFHVYSDGACDFVMRESQLYVIASSAVSEWIMFIAASATSLLFTVQWPVDRKSRAVLRHDFAASRTNPQNLACMPREFTCKECCVPIIGGWGGGRTTNERKKRFLIAGFDDQYQILGNLNICLVDYWEQAGPENRNLREKVWREMHVQIKRNHHHQVIF